MVNKLVMPLFMVVFICFACTGNSNTLVCLNDDIMPIVKDYISKNPQWNTFVLQNTVLHIEEEYRYERGFILGPGYPSLLSYLNDSSLYFNIDGNRLYYVGDFSQIIKKNDESDHWINKNEEDSIVKIDTLVDLRGRVIDANHHIYFTDPVIRYYTNGIYLYNIGGKWLINNKPDTLFIPQLGNTIQFR